MKIYAIELYRCQTGWRCAVTFSVTTSRQFTDESHGVVTGGKWMLTAIWNGIRLSRREAKTMAARPGERAAKGWAD